MIELMKKKKKYIYIYLLDVCVGFNCFSYDFLMRLFLRVNLELQPSS